MNKPYLVNVEEVQSTLDVGKSKAYRIIHDMNTELLKSGHMVVAGKVPRPYFEKKLFGYTEMISEKGA